MSARLLQRPYIKVLYYRRLSTNVKIIPLGASSGKRNVTVWRSSVCLSRQQTHRDSPGGSIRHGNCSFRPDNNED